MFGKQLKHYRKLRKYTQKELAGRLNVSQQTIAAWEYGRTSPTPDMIASISSVLEVSADRLLCQETDELTEYLALLKERSDMRMLFSLAKDATVEEVQEAVKIIEALRNR